MIEEQVVEKIARAFHDEYEAFAEANGWETQKRSRVAFDDLPAENRATMISTVRALLHRRIIRPSAPTTLSADQTLVQRIRNLAHIAEAPGMAEAMEESEVIAETVREIDSGTMYLGIEDEIHAIADAVEGDGSPYAVTLEARRDGQLVHLCTHHVRASNSKDATEAAVEELRKRQVKPDELEINATTVPG